MCLEINLTGISSSSDSFNTENPLWNHFVQSTGLVLVPILASDIAFFPQKFICKFSLSLLLKVFSHFSHLNSFSVICFLVGHLKYSCILCLKMAAKAPHGKDGYSGQRILQEPYTLFEVGQSSYQE